MTLRWQEKQNLRQWEQCDKKVIGFWSSWFLRRVKTSWSYNMATHLDRNHAPWLSPYSLNIILHESSLQCWVVYITLSVLILLLHLHGHTPWLNDLYVRLTAHVIANYNLKRFGVNLLTASMNGWCNYTSSPNLVDRVLTKFILASSLVMYVI